MLCEARLIQVAIGVCCDDNDRHQPHDQAVLDGGGALLLTGEAVHDGVLGVGDVLEGDENGQHGVSSR